MLPKMLKILLICIVALLLTAQSGICKDGAVKIGVMNLQKVLAISNTGLAVKDAVTKKFEGYQAKLRKEEESLMTLKDEIEKKAAVWSEDVKITKEREFKRRVQDLEDESAYASNDMKEYEKGQVEPLLKELEKIIDETGKAGGYTLILDTSKGVLYQDEAIDISADLAAELDKRHSNSK
jgi:outer membrane protein